jgi:hypothetical protein
VINRWSSAAVGWNNPFQRVDPDQNADVRGVSFDRVDQGVAVGSASLDVDRGEFAAHGAV